MNILDFLFPKKCAGCNKLGTYFCPKCILEIKQGDLICPFCERPAMGGIAHPICRRRYGLDGLWSLGVYEGLLRVAIQKLKYKWVEEFGEALINILLEYWVKNPPILLDQIKKDQGKNWLIVPVPLHWIKTNLRGFNQASLLGRLLAEKLGLNYSDILKRTKMTKSQVGLDSQKRRQNIKGAFSLNTTYSILNTNVLLVDDVWTTGSTLKECCYVLKRGGVKKVWALTLAR